MFSLLFLIHGYMYHHFICLCTSVSIREHVLEESVIHPSPKTRLGGFVINQMTWLFTVVEHLSLKILDLNMCESVKFGEIKSDVYQ